MTTECNPAYLDFPMLGSRQVLADFDGGDISTDGGALLLREAERLTGIIRQFAACFTDHRDPDLVEHQVEHLLAQRVYGLALGYEDLIDHDDLRRDPLLATVVGKDDPSGKTRRRQRDRGKPLAGKGTLNRLELTPVAPAKSGPIQEGRLPHPGRRGALRHPLPPGPLTPARADRPGPRRHRRPDPRPSARPLLPRLLQGFLLPPAVHLLRRSPALCPPSALGYRRQRRVGEAPEADRHPDPSGVAR